MNDNTKTTKTAGKSKDSPGGAERTVKVRILGPGEGEEPGVSVAGMTHYEGSVCYCTDEQAAALEKVKRAKRIGVR